MPNYSNRAKKAWATRRANQQVNSRSHSLRAKKAWATIRAKQVAANNAAFLGLSPAGKRVAIAKDVIAALQAQQLYPKAGVWASFDNLQNLEVGTELQPVFREENCEACALGACFVSAVKLGNNCKLTEDAKVEDGFMFSTPSGDWGEDQTGVWRTLKRYFTERQLALIELAFENGEGYFKYDAVVEAEANAASDFHYRYEDDADRMLAIMKNIVSNNGTFRP